MGLAMGKVWEHPRSGNYWYRKATPADLMAKRKVLAAMGITLAREAKKSLKTTDLKKAKSKWAEVHAAQSKEWDAMRDVLANGPKPLSQKDIAALAGDIAREVLKSEAEVDDALIATSQFGMLKASWALTAEAFKLIGEYGPERYPQVDVMLDKIMRSELLKHGIVATDDASWGKLKARVVKDLPAIAAMLANKQDGDYREPEWLQGRPEFKVMKATIITFESLIEGWKRERRPKEESVRAYRRRCKALTDYLGHDNAAKVTKADIQRWKDHMLALPDANMKDIRDKLADVRTIFKWALENGKLPQNVNPAQDIKVTWKGKSAPRRGYSDEEAIQLLQAARRERGFARWGIWLLAYSGMRAGEAAQLRVSDVQQDKEGNWTVRATPEAGRLKNKASNRSFPLHSAVVKEGFGEYVKALNPNGRLFPELYVRNEARGVTDATALSIKAANKAREAVRRMIDGLDGFEKSDDAAINHAWRHRAKSLFREHDVSIAAQFAIIGHEESGIGGQYGERPSIAKLRRDIEKIPALVIEGPASDNFGLAEMPSKAELTRLAASRVPKVKLKPIVGAAKGRERKS